MKHNILLDYIPVRIGIPLDLYNILFNLIFLLLSKNIFEIIILSIYTILYIFMLGIWVDYMSLSCTSSNLFSV